jgi:hypothetical protein
MGEWCGGRYATLFGFRLSSFPKGVLAEASVVRGMSVQAPERRWSLRGSSCSCTPHGPCEGIVVRVRVLRVIGSGSAPHSSAGSARARSEIMCGSEKSRADTGGVWAGDIPRHGPDIRIGDRILDV